MDTTFPTLVEIPVGTKNHPFGGIFSPGAALRREECFIKFDNPEDEKRNWETSRVFWGSDTGKIIMKALKKGPALCE